MKIGTNDKKEGFKTTLNRSHNESHKLDLRASLKESSLSKIKLENIKADLNKISFKKNPSVIENSRSSKIV